MCFISTRTSACSHYDSNHRAELRSMVIGSDAFHLNEPLAIIAVPGITQATFTAIEHGIGDM